MCRGPVHTTRSSPVFTSKVHRKLVTAGRGAACANSSPITKSMLIVYHNLTGGMRIGLE
jgi:hypothetical protein